MNAAADATTTSAPAAASVRRLSVAVLGGGSSGEREVSLASARGVAASLRRSADATFVVGDGSCAVGEVLEVELAVDGSWRFDGAVHSPAQALLALERVDVFFLALHGGQGEDGTIQGLLAAAGRRHTGSDVRASAVCMDKLATRGLASAVGLRVAPGAIVDRAAWRAARGAELARLAALARVGWVVKPRCGGSSVNTSMVRDAEHLAPAVERVLAVGDEALVEARVEGVELSCGVIENVQGRSHALMPIEIQPADGRFFDYEQKYDAAGAREVCPPLSVDESSIERVRALARRIHDAAGCRGYSRSDFIVPRVGGSFGEPCLLEVNTLPGLTERSLLPQEAAYEGVGYDELCRRIVASALRGEGVLA